MRNSQRKFLLKVCSYGIIGLIGTLIHLLTLVILVENFRCDPVISSAVGFILALVVSFLLNKTITFKGKSNQAFTLLIKYTVVSCLGFLMNSAIMYSTVHIFMLHYALGQAIVIIILPATNFLVNNYWTFKDPAI